MYKEAGVNDVRKFYDDKFVSNYNYDCSSVFMASYNINYSKFLWIYRNVKPHSNVLDFGCGSGTLSILKQKGCHLTGIDFSKKALEIAKNVNGYDSVFCGDIKDYNGPKEYFDCIVSLDVFGHIPFEDKDATIQVLKKYLKRDGVMVHGIECGNVDYGKMTREQLKEFVDVDGHVGVEDKLSNINRFKKYFNYVEGDVRFCIENSVDEYIKQADSYGRDFDEYLISYLKGMNEEEKLAFNVANGLVQMRMEQFKVDLPNDLGGFLYLRASDVSLKKLDFELFKGGKKFNGGGNNVSRWKSNRNRVNKVIYYINRFIFRK